MSGKLIERICLDCKKQDYVYFRSNRAPSNYCSSCVKKGSRNQNWKGGLTEIFWKIKYKKVEKVCPECRSSFVTSKSYKTFCSERCEKKMHNRLNHKKYKHVRRAREVNANGFFDPAEFLSLVERLENKCPGCGIWFESKDFTIDHIVPLSKGGTNFIQNIQPLCMRCNVRKNARTINFLETTAIPTGTLVNRPLCS